MSPPATLLMRLQLRSPELTEGYAVSDWRLTRPADVPGQSMGQADDLLIAEILEVERVQADTLSPHCRTRWRQRSPRTGP